MGTGRCITNEVSEKRTQIGKVRCITNEVGEKRTQIGKVRCKINSGYHTLF